MAKDHRRVDVQMAQEVLLDDPGFLRELVERVVQQVLEAEMTEHIGAACEQATGGCGRQLGSARPIYSQA
jgi:transposase-like protein